ncbi:MAG: DUF296 domain-containing protein [Pseudomonadota bacterium]
MKYQAGKIGRVLWVRFDAGEDLRVGLLELAEKEGIDRAMVLALGALERGRLVVGPREAVVPPDPVWVGFADGREILGLGTLAPGPDGPSLHFHLGAGRGGEPSLLGCLRDSSEVYLTLECVVLELSGLTVARVPDAASGQNLLSFD